MSNKYIGFNGFLSMLRGKFPAASRMDAIRLYRSLPYRWEHVKGRSSLRLELGYVDAKKLITKKKKLREYAPTGKDVRI